MLQKLLEATTITAWNIFDPLNRDLRGSIYAAEALTGEDYYCMEYVGAFREGIFGPQDKK